MIDEDSRNQHEKDLSISVCVIARNEEKTVGDIIQKAKAFCDEVVLVDGHSHDSTRTIAESLGAKVFLDSGGGKGSGVREAIKRASGGIIVCIDADGSHDPVDIPKLVQPILKGKADLVIGSRGLGGSDELHGDFDKFLRVTGSHIITLGINYYFNVRLTDSQNGFRAIRTSCARKLDLKEEITTIEQEMLIKTLHKKFRVSEVPVHEYKRLHGESTIKLQKVFWRYFYSWIRYLLFK
jgi:glycosyltransferase involved in cell wall biosynthesis